jgi:hypothetical protein
VLSQVLAARLWSIWLSLAAAVGVVVCQTIQPLSLVAVVVLVV